MTSANNSPRLIEGDGFPIEFLSQIAERESWRKEVYRPIYHVHKWWAKRLGSIFRGAILGAVLPEGAKLHTAFYRPQDISNFSVFDPFMGSGTTVGEAHKLGAAALGRDINPVAAEAVRVALGPMDGAKLREAFRGLSATVGERIRQLYEAEDENGDKCDVLYHFWVMRAECPNCAKANDLFSSRVLARNAYPDRKPQIQVACPACEHVFPSLNSEVSARCPACSSGFDIHSGPAKGSKCTCTGCALSFSIADAIRSQGTPPDFRLYAKLLLTQGGGKKYLQATEMDRAAHREAAKLLAAEVRDGKIRLPLGRLEDGHNTRQAIGYGFRQWSDFFNPRQLLALGWLHEAIAALPDLAARDALLTLFSGVLEFNNRFASYKGEGTGAVRHMFSHHILKPERTPIEANVWGTPKSSGSFSNLFQSRLLRAVEYRAAPFEVALGPNGKVAGCSLPITGSLVPAWPVSGNFQPRAVYLSCGDSSQTGLPARSVDAIVTDPPFFDNVHYSELADFFHAWQRLHPRGLLHGATSTRHVGEVQDAQADAFAGKLQSVLAECHRILKDDGLLVFSYHHSRDEGWTTLAQAIFGAGFTVINAQPVKAEMSGATPKSQAKEPIQLDILLVCRKRQFDRRPCRRNAEAAKAAREQALEKAARLTAAGFHLSKNDVKIILGSEYLRSIGPVSIDELPGHLPTLIEVTGFLLEVSEDSLVMARSGIKNGIPSSQMSLAL